MLVTIGLFVLSQWAAHASPITYTLTNTLSGTLGGTAFNALVTLTLTGDTSTIARYPDSIVGPGWMNEGAARISIPGLGTATFTDSIIITAGIVAPDDFVVAILNNTQRTVIMFQTLYELGTAGAALFGSGYDLRAVGPITGEGGSAFTTSSPSFPTTAGNLTWTLDRTFGTSSTFTATSTPEPGTLLLLCTGLAAAVLRRARA